MTVPAIFEEGEPLEKAGIQWRDRLFVSDRAHMLFDFHKEIDGIQERNRGSSAIGTTKKGIGPCYASKASRTGIRVGDLKRFDDVFVPKLRHAVEIAKSQYGAENFGNYDVEKEIEEYRRYADMLGPMIVDGVRFINEAYDRGERIITEGANAAMLDLDYGTFPFVTSSSTTSGGIATGLGLSPDKISCAIGVVKAYVVFEREAREFHSNHFPHVVTRISLPTHSNHVYYSLIAQENHSNTNAQMPTQM